MSSFEIDRLINIVSRLPGMGQRSACRVVVHLLKRKHSVMENLIKTLSATYNNSVVCEICNNIDTVSPCRICANLKRDHMIVCVVSDVSDIWSVERAGFYKGTYHVLGGKLSAIDGVKPSDLSIEKLVSRIKNGDISEVIMAMSADIDGQTTMFFVRDRIKDLGCKITVLSHGMPVGGELEQLDEGTIITAFNQRRDI